MIETVPSFFVNRYCATDGMMANPQLFTADAQCTIEQAATLAAISERQILEPVHLFLIQTRRMADTKLFSAADAEYLRAKCMEVIKPDPNVSAPWRHSGIDIAPQTIEAVSEAYQRSTLRNGLVGVHGLYPEVTRKLDAQFRYEVMDERGLNLDEIAAYFALLRHRN